VRLESVLAIAGKGLEGDRYFKRVGTYASAGKLGAGKEVTLIEEESLEHVRDEHGIPVSFEETRRNLLVRGVRLNDLVGREFSVGEVVLLGARLCHPCVKLAARTKKPLLRPLAQRGGLMARIVLGGTLRVGDEVRTAPAATPEAATPEAPTSPPAAPRSAPASTEPPGRPEPARARARGPRSPGPRAPSVPSRSREPSRRKGRSRRAR
jgi:MOSC domain-containing protein YiiM